MILVPCTDGKRRTARKALSTSINERLAQVECILDEADVAGFLRAVGNDDLNDVEAEMNPRVAEQPQIIERSFADVALLLALDRLTRQAEFLCLAGLYLDEYEPILLAGDDINLRLAATEVLQENLVTVAAQVFRRRFLAARAQHLPRGPVIFLSFKPTEEHKLIASIPAYVVAALRMLSERGYNATNSTCTGSMAS